MTMPLDMAARAWRPGRRGRAAGQATRAFMRSPTRGWLGMPEQVGLKACTLQEFPDTAVGGPLEEPAGTESAAALIYTGGTTSAPQALCYGTAIWCRTC